MRLKAPIAPPIIFAIKSGSAVRSVKGNSTGRRRKAMIFSRRAEIEEIPAVDRRIGADPSRPGEGGREGLDDEPVGAGIMQALPKGSHLYEQVAPEGMKR